MKQNWISPTRIVVLGTALAGALFFTSCKKDDDKNQNNTYTISGSGSASQVVPAYSGTGTGTITGTYNKQTNMLNYNVGWNGLTDTASTVAFYTGAAGVAGTQAQALTVSTQGMTGNSTGSITLTDAQETDLMNGNWYYTVGTLANPTGEIRGQVSTAQ